MTEADYLHDKLRKLYESLKRMEAQKILLQHALEDAKLQLKTWENERVEATAAYYVVDDLIFEVKTNDMTYEQFYSKVVEAMDLLRFDKNKRPAESESVRPKFLIQNK